MDGDVILSVEGLKTYFFTEGSTIRAVDGVSFEVRRGETLGVVGESGCGKSLTALSVLQLVPQPYGKIAAGRIVYNKNHDHLYDITALDPNSLEMRAIRGNEIAMIFQDPMASLNPLYTIGEQIMEGIRLHQHKRSRDARHRAIEMLDRVGIPGAKQRIDEYPHQYSGGMCQRAMIAMALSCDPKFLIADEPTTALDVTIEAQILELIKDLQRDSGMSLMMITHDMGVISEMAKSVIVMYTGKVVEQASTEDIFSNPKHPYTIGLLQSIPKIGRKGKLAPIRGSVPNIIHLPPGCHFSARCPEVMGICREQEPPTYTIEEGHYTKCWLYEGKERYTSGRE